jgi:hypothetical protein
VIMAQDMIGVEKKLCALPKEKKNERKKEPHGRFSGLYLC